MNNHMAKMQTQKARNSSHQRTEIFVQATKETCIQMQNT